MRGTAIAQVVFEEQGPDSLAYEDDRFGDDGGLALRAALLGVCAAGWGIASAMRASRPFETAPSEAG